MDGFSVGTREQLRSVFFCMIVLGLFQAACQSNGSLELNSYVDTVVDRITSSKETTILAMPKQAQYFRVNVHGPVEEGAFLLVRSTEEKSIRDYRYEIPRHGMVYALTPESAVNLQIGVVNARRII